MWKFYRLTYKNHLFNIFKQEELEQALQEMYRVLKPRGRLVMSDPTCEQDIPENLREDERLRALCLSGSLPLWDYIKMITDAGFGIQWPKNYDRLEITTHGNSDLNTLNIIRTIV